MSSGFHVCCLYSNALQAKFILREQSDLGSYCLQYRPPKYIRRREGGRGGGREREWEEGWEREQTTVVVNSRNRG